MPFQLRVCSVEARTRTVLIWMPRTKGQSFFQLSVGSHAPTTGGHVAAAPSMVAAEGEGFTACRIDTFSLLAWSSDAQRLSSGSDRLPKGLPVSGTLRSSTNSKPNSWAALTASAWVGAISSVMAETRARERRGFAACINPAADRANRVRRVTIAMIVQTAAQAATRAAIVRDEKTNEAGIVSRSRGRHWGAARADWRDCGAQGRYSVGIHCGNVKSHC